MEPADLWPIALDAVQALGRQYSPAMDQAAAESNLSGGYGWLLGALAFDPEPLSAARLRVRTPYTSPQWYKVRLQMAAEQGYLAPTVAEGDEYCLTEQGRQAADRIMKAAFAQMETLQPLPAADLERLAALLRRLVMACLEAPEPPGKWCILHSRRTDPGEGASVIARIDQYISDLATYRDDAHLASWQPHSIEGNAWEAFTFLWQGEAATLDGLYPKVARRGYAQEDYQQALADLTRRGWICEINGAYQVTDRGRRIRQEAEEATDTYFYAPWACLSPDEADALHTLLIRFKAAFETVSE